MKRTKRTSDKGEHRDLGSDALLISIGGLIEAIRHGLLRHFADEDDLILSGQEANRIALDIVQSEVVERRIQNNPKLY